MADPPTFKVILTGPRGAGKTSFMRCLKGDISGEEEYVPTPVGEKHIITISTTHGPIRFEVLEISEWERKDELGVDLSVAHAYLLMAIGIKTKKSKNSTKVPVIEEVPSEWIARFDTIRTNVSARILLCRNIFANKSFGKYRAWSSCAHSVNISVTTLENIHQPLLLLARNLLGDSNLEYHGPRSWYVEPTDCNVGLNRTVPVEDNPNSERPDAGQATEIVDDDEDTSCYTPDTSIDESVIDDQEENTEFEKPCLFVLCSGCIRMLSIHFSADAKSKFKKRAPLDDGPGLVVTTCRACSKQLMSQRLVTATKFVQQTTMWACARKVAGEDVDIFETSGMIVHVSVEELARILSIDCRVHPIDTNAETLGKLNEVNRSDLVLPYMPGGFF